MKTKTISISINDNIPLYYFTDYTKKMKSEIRSRITHIESPRKTPHRDGSGRGVGRVSIVYLLNTILLILSLYNYLYLVYTTYTYYLYIAICTYFTLFIPITYYTFYITIYKYCTILWLFPGFRRNARSLLIWALLPCATH